MASIYLKVMNTTFSLFFIFLLAELKSTENYTKTKILINIFLTLKTLISLLMNRGERDVLMFYQLPFRILKIKLSNETYETIITNLSAEDFPLEEVKRLYSMRWEIETSFRDLKYPLGLLNFHARKTEVVYQEIYAHLMLYNFVSLIMSS